MLAQGTNAAQPMPSRPLERMSIAADEVFRIAGTVQAFLDRFHGEGPADSASAGNAIQVSYRSEIDRLFAHLDMLSARVGALHDIG